MRLTTAVLVAALCGFITVSAHAKDAAPEQTVTVYVTSAGAKDGFTDPSKDNRDSVKDLRDSLNGRKGIRLTDARADAQIVLTVQQRETAGVTVGFFANGRDRIMHVHFEAATVDTDLTASVMGGLAGSGGAWGKAAGKIAKQVEEWVKENGKALQAHSQ
jgi:hypothetical protein